MSDYKKLVLAIGGSSGSVYAYRLMKKLRPMVSELKVSTIMTDNAVINWQNEVGEFNPTEWPFQHYQNRDFNAPFASGSSDFGTMIICPCSMGLLGRIANGISDDLISRSADVILKERRKLIVVPRETPYNLIHLRNMVTLTEAGAIICPATPSFYSKPTTIDEVIDTVIDRILDLAGMPITTFRWGSKNITDV